MMKVSEPKHHKCSIAGEEEHYERTFELLLADIAEVRVLPCSRNRLGLRYPHCPEVQRIRQTLQLPADGSSIEVNVVLSALKAILEEKGDFCTLVNGSSTEESMEKIATDIESWLAELKPRQRQLICLLGRALKHLAHQCRGTSVDAYTDMLLIFTPFLFPGASSDVRKFLKAIQSTLAIVEHGARTASRVANSPTQFSHSASTPTTSAALMDSAYISDEEWPQDPSEEGEYLDNVWGLDTLGSSDEGSYVDEWNITEDENEDGEEKEQEYYPNISNDGCCDPADEVGNAMPPDYLIDYYHIAFLRKA